MCFKLSLHCNVCNKNKEEYRLHVFDILSPYCCKKFKNECKACSLNLERQKFKISLNQIMESLCYLLIDAFPIESES